MVAVVLEFDGGRNFTRDGGIAHGHHCQGTEGGASANVPGLQSGGGGNSDKGSRGTIRMTMDLKIF